MDIFMLFQDISHVKSEILKAIGSVRENLLNIQSKNRFFTVGTYSNAMACQFFPPNMGFESLTFRFSFVSGLFLCCQLYSCQNAHF